MNINAAPVTDTPITTIPVTDVPISKIQTTLEIILSSNLFINAPRASRLLRFLVEKALFGSTRDTSEYAIGIEVFDRDPIAYSTGEDPVVRVQIGRLRQKLKIYYATLGRNHDTEIVIPLGCYMPIFNYNNLIENSFYQILLAINPFKCISYHHHGEFLTQGLHEELMHRLFKSFDNILVTPMLFIANDDHETKIPDFKFNYLLQGSVQLDAKNIRISIRIINRLGHIAWSEQFNREALFDISVHEELASTICNSLQHFFFNTCYSDSD